MTQSANPYRVRDGDAHRDRDAVLAAWRGNLGRDEAMAAKYDWFYLQAPTGPPLLQVLEHEGAVVGSAAAGARTMHWPAAAGAQTATTIAGVLVDLAVAPAHRSLGPALMLQQGVAGRGLERFGLLYGFPNPKSAAVFRRMGYRQVGSLPRYARAVRHRPYLHTRMPRPLAAIAGQLLDGIDGLRRLSLTRGLRATWRDALPPAAVELCQRHPLPGVWTNTRDAAQLRWRLEQAPNVRIRHLVVDAVSADERLAWFATRVEDRALVVVDCWCRDPGEGMPAAAVAVLLREARRAGLQSVSIELATSPRRLRGWLRQGFRERGSRPVFAVWPGMADASAPLDMHLTAADEDE